jgi:hypothetical protein
LRRLRVEPLDRGAASCSVCRSARERCSRRGACAHPSARSS